MSPVGSLRMFPMSLKITLYGRLISGTGGGFRAASLACDPDLGRC